MRLIDADVLKQHIDKLPALSDGNFAGNHSALKALINMQPTIEPSTNCSEFTNNSDTISRAKAIEALDKRFDSIPMEQTSEILMLRKDLRDLPPAQPEHIIHCKDCENHLYRDWCRLDSKNTVDLPETEGSDPSQIAAQIIHEAIDNTTFAEEEYHGIKEQLHRSVEEWEKLQPVFTEIAEEYKKSCGISFINKPLAHALYEVWKKHDRRDTNRNETKTGPKDQRRT